MNHGVQHERVQELLQVTLQQGKHPILHVVSNSMAPLLRSGDLVRIEDVAPADLAPGDIIVMRTGTQWVTHRYWGATSIEDRLYLLTRGDRVPIFDQPWLADKLLGRVLSRQRAGQELSLRSPEGRRLNRWMACLVAWEIRWFRLQTVQEDSILPNWSVPAWLRGRHLHRIATRVRYMLASVLLWIDRGKQKVAP